jgi:hypothetical protein
MAERRGSRWQAVKAVFWSFFGVRRKKHYEEDTLHLKPLEVILAGLAGVLVLILTLLGMVWLIAHLAGNQ